MRLRIFIARKVNQNTIPKDFVSHPVMTDFAQLVAYVLVGGAVTLADLALYNALTGGRVRMPRLRANVVSTSCGMAVGFALHFAVVFHPHEPQVPARIVKYLATMACSLYGVQNGVIYVLGERWRGPVRLAQGMARQLEWGGLDSASFIDRMTGKVLGALAGMVWNFLLF